MAAKLEFNILKKKKKSIKPKDDPKKEEINKGLSAFFSDNGFRVRRERLGQGLGWKAVSGLCRVNDENLIFLDRRLEQDDQILFLITKIKEKNLNISSDLLSNVPDKLKKIAKL